MRPRRTVLWKVLAAFLLLGVALPLLAISGCWDAGGAIGAGGRSCGYPSPWLDALGLWVFDWVAISTMMFGVPVLMIWTALAILLYRFFSTFDRADG